MILYFTSCTQTMCICMCVCCVCVCVCVCVHCNLTNHESDLPQLVAVDFSKMNL